MPKLDQLPSSYTVADVIGATKGRELWTVYFRDGTHFTQCHGRRGNLALEPPRRHLYFKNVSTAVINAKKAEALTLARRRNVPFVSAFHHVMSQWGEIAAAIQLGQIVAPTAGVAVAPNTHQLYEVTLDPQNQRRYHISGGWIEALTMSEKMEVLRGIRKRTTTKLLNGATAHWYYATAEEAKRNEAVDIYA